MEKINFLNIPKIGQTWDIVWAHAVNNKKRLDKSIYTSEIMMIEGDISASSEGAIIMAHPPASTSDLTFEDWITEIIDSKKGAKLDFKNPEIVTEILVKLEKLNPQIPIILHADVLQGPGGRPPIFDAATFIEACLKHYPNGILGLGWTTKCIPEEKYSENMIDEMIGIISGIDNSRILTISVRACYLTTLPETFFDAIKRNSNIFITLWNSKNDPSLFKGLEKWVEKHIGLDKVFRDLVYNPLNESS